MRGYKVTGIIPARAGFTPANQQELSSETDHPRSRGVYVSIVENIVDIAGSSPLARGLLKDTATNMWSDRIIPARAGFTPVGENG